MEFITINDASSLAGKSIQTIRRMIKRRKIQVKKQKTPQGFNYMVIKESLLDFMKNNTEVEVEETETTEPTPGIQNEREHRPIENSGIDLLKAELSGFNTTMQKLIDQNQNDKQNFFQLIQTFQDRVVALEGQIKLLEAPKKRWWQSKVW